MTVRVRRTRTVCHIVLLSIFKTLFVRRRLNANRPAVDGDVSEAANERLVDRRYCAAQVSRLRYTSDVQPAF